MKAMRYAKRGITSITHQNTAAAMALAYSDIIINAARTVDKGVIEVSENESWEWLNVHVVPRVRYMGKGTEGL